MTKKQKMQKLSNRVFRSYLSATVSITLVLFLVGLMSLLAVNVDRLSDYVRENIGFTLILKDDVKEVDIMRLQKLLDATDYVKSSKYIDKETAAAQLKEELGEDFEGFLGFNPLAATIDVKLYADYTHPEKLAELEKEFLAFPQVKEVHYQRDIMNTVNENVSKLGLIVLLFSLLLLIIFITLINNTIRISVYSQRFVIHTMQLVGATQSFVRKPFIMRSLKYGMLGALIANVLLAVTFFSYQTEFATVLNESGIEILILVFLIVFATGALISWLSTRFAVNKFLRLRFDELF